MEIMFYLTLVLVAVLAQGDSASRMSEENSNSNGKGEKEEDTYESFDSPVYGASNILPFPGYPVSGKSAYNYPVPPVSPLASLPGSYAGFVTSLGLNNPYAYGAYNRYNYMPYTSPYYGYATSPNALGYGSALYSGLGYGGLASPYYGRSAYPLDNYNYPGYVAGLGYRYGGRLNYLPGALRAAPVAKTALPAYSVPPPVSSGPVPIPPAAATYPVPGPVVSPYRFPVRAVANKDGSVRYAYASSDAQTLAGY